MKAKRLLVILLTIALAFSFGISALAADPPATGTITINAPEDITGRKFEAYRLFTVENIYTDTTVEPNVVHTTYAPTALLKASVDAIEDTTVPLPWTDADYVKYVSECDTADERAALAAAVKAELGTNDYASERRIATGAGESATFGEVPYGYYIIIETTEGIDGISPMLFALQETNAEFDIKADFPEFEKEVDDSGNLDFMIGSTVPYILKAAYPLIPEGATEAWHKFSDTLSAGLTLDKTSIVLEIDGTEYDVDDIEANAAITLTFTTNGFVLEVDYLALGGTIATGAAVTVSYEATLNEDAIVKNGNDARLNYSNDPTNKGLTDSKDVYTYGFDIEKIDSDSEITLAGAEFALKDATGKTLTFIVDATGRYVYSEATGADSKLVSDANGMIKIFGLDAGTYTLTETKAPTGYNELADDLIVVITPVGDDLEEWTVSYGADADKLIVVDHTVPITIVNTSSIILPGTGGIGTAIFTLTGALSVSGAAAFLTLNKKRIFGK